MAAARLCGFRASIRDCAYIRLLNQDPGLKLTIGIDGYDDIWKIPCDF